MSNQKRNMGSDKIEKVARNLFDFKNKKYLYLPIQIGNPAIHPPVYIPCEENESISDLKKRIQFIFNNNSELSLIRPIKEDENIDALGDEMGKIIEGSKMFIRSFGPDGEDDVIDMTVEEYQNQEKQREIETLALEKIKKVVEEFKKSPNDLLKISDGIKLYVEMKN